MNDSIYKANIVFSLYWQPDGITSCNPQRGEVSTRSKQQPQGCCFYFLMPVKLKRVWLKGITSGDPQRGGVNQIKATSLRDVVFIFSDWQAQTSLACLPEKIKMPRCAGHLDLVAERKGFEPLVPVRVQRFSRPPHSTALASLRIIGECKSKDFINIYPLNII